MGKFSANFPSFFESAAETIAVQSMRLFECMLSFVKLAIAPSAIVSREYLIFTKMTFFLVLWRSPP
ncbi:hypothetical protein [Microcoleus sp. bin38.metabat.b11b12b14.051]|uniref:hypothetical protein n=1 Tax=Microcoleus sp. bin38.metabat.b11b12b14.051 TaxID=2742709 RepID=UPI0025CCDEE7|nr:hypothetical protein [Microcoleus sp. bin38.metabat.b11b12b14.051]